MSEVINIMALDISKANFMATHAPFSRLQYVKSPRGPVSLDDAELLRDFQSCAQENRHGMFVVLGIPGTGKSHLIRWLKERYDAEQREHGGKPDVVLLIKRASGSLRGTLEQLLQSGEFAAGDMTEDLRRLEGATERLSSAGLMDALLNNLQLAMTEVQLPPADQPRDYLIQRGALQFILDIHVREDLKRPGGPIERIRTYLVGRNIGQPGDDESPGFTADDFYYGQRMDLLQNVRGFAAGGGYAAARNLVENLARPVRHKLREELAAYLNRLLRFAIQQATALSGDQLKAMFLKRRRELRAQGRGLALFIEDITAITGLDAGLLDALITAHGGENEDLCRLVSIVGITDDYYQSQIPDNVRDRVGYLLTLNPVERGRAPEFLDSSRATADFAARYLNALRCSQDELDKWLAEGAAPERLPNTCLACPHRPACHAAFGSVNLGPEGGPEVPVGLYPFNEAAVWRMFDRLDLTRATRTPRKLLTSVIQYVLQVHGPLVVQGQFPPPRLGADFSPPTLEYELQRRIIQTQAGGDAGRLESLVVFWGDRSVWSRTADGQRRLGGLPEAVFTAFTVPFIQGQLTDEPPQLLPPPILVPPGGQGPAPPPLPTVDRHVSDIREWAEGTRRLRYRDDYADWLTSLCLTYVDWEAHGLTTAQAGERLKRRFVFFEQQLDEPTTQLPYRLPRTGETEDLLYALAGMFGPGGSDDAATIGGYLATLSAWLAAHEADLVAFIGAPQADLAVPLRDVLAGNVLRLAVLDGQLSPRIEDLRDLMLAVVSSCVTELGQGGRSISPWRVTAAQLEHRTQRWVNLVAQLTSEHVRVTRESLLKVCNCAQGGSTDVRYLDAPRLLDSLAAFQANDWHRPDLPVTGPGSDMWDLALQVNGVLATRFAEAAVAEQDRLRLRLERLETMLGDREPKEVQQAIVEVRAELARSQIAAQFDVWTLERVQALEDQLPELRSIASTSGLPSVAVRLSGGGSAIQVLERSVAFLERVLGALEATRSSLAESISNLEGEAGITDLNQQLERLYRESLVLLDQVTGQPSDQETSA